VHRHLLHAQVSRRRHAEMTDYDHVRGIAYDGLPPSEFADRRGDLLDGLGGPLAGILGVRQLSIVTPLRPGRPFAVRLSLKCHYNGVKKREIEGNRMRLENR
jgi:hypothetical protein